MSESATAGLSDLDTGPGRLLIGILVALFLEDWRAGVAFAIFSFATTG